MDSTRELRDQREMLRWRHVPGGVAQPDQEPHAGVLLRCNVTVTATDLYGAASRAELQQRWTELPEWTRQSVQEQLETIHHLDQQIGECEQTLESLLENSAERDLLETLPGVGKVLSAVIALEIGDVSRFPTAQHSASYAGLVPAARESAAKKRPGKCPADCNTYLKWAFIEAGNVVSLHHKRWPERHVAQFYARVKQKSRMHGKATVAVARHLAEASYWMLTKQQTYREPNRNRPDLSSTHG